MAIKNLERRIAELETQMREMQSQLGGAGQRSATPDWRRAVASFSGDADLQSVFTEALKLREVDRKRARRRSVKSRKPHQ